MFRFLVELMPHKNIDAAELTLREANHRIANSLSSLAAGISQSARRLFRDDGAGKVEALEALHEIGQRLYMVGRLHRAFAATPAGNDIDIGAHLREICQSAVAALAPQRVRLNTEGISTCLAPSDIALELCQITTELVINSIKYAHPSGVVGIIEVHCERLEDGTLVVEFADDGVGLPEGFDPRADGGIGLQIIYALADQIDADVQFQPRAIGAAIKITCPARRETLTQLCGGLAGRYPNLTIVRDGDDVPSD